MSNPFTPTFGIVPAYPAGRQTLLLQMRKAFANGIGDPNLSSIIMGPRGSGKTALLNCIAEEANKEGWIVANTAAHRGMLEDILERTLAVSAEISHPETTRKLTGLTIGQFLGIEWSEKDAKELNWRSRITNITNALGKHGTGLLITVDEVRADEDEMIQLASVYQLLIREGAKVALVMAGLSGQLNDLMHNEKVTFLRRSRRHVLGLISDADIDLAFRKTAEGAGKVFSPEALAKAVKASGGYAYMMQLVGFYIWEESGESSVIDHKAAINGIRIAQKEFRDGVLSSTYRELSAGDRAFLSAMLHASDSCRLTDIASRLNKTTGYASTYKSRLLRAGVIEELPDHTLVFSLPSFREFLLGVNEENPNNKV